MALCDTSSLLLAAHWLHAVHLLKVPAVNGTVLAVTIFSQIQVVLSCVLLGATIFWTCIKIAKALRERPKSEIWSDRCGCTL